MPLWFALITKIEIPYEADTKPNALSIWESVAAGEKQVAGLRVRDWMERPQLLFRQGLWQKLYREGRVSTNGPEWALRLPSPLSFSRETRIHLFTYSLTRC